MNLLEAMRMFRMVAEGRSLSEVGRRSGQTASTVSRRIQALEVHLGVRLLQRTTRDVQLTAMGAEYLERIAPILDELEVTHRMVAERQAAPSGLLRVTAPPRLAATRIAPLIPEFIARHPGVRLELITTSQILNSIQENIDLAIRIGTLPDSTLVARKLTSYEFVCCGAPRYFKEHGRPRHPDDLRGRNCLVSTPERNAIWEFEKGGKRFRVRVAGDVRSTDPEVVHQVVLRGGGIAMLPLWIVEESVAARKLEAVLPSYRALQWGRENAVYAVYPTRRHLPRTVREFLQFLVERFEK